MAASIFCVLGIFGKPAQTAWARSQRAWVVHWFIKPLLARRFPALLSISLLIVWSVEPLPEHASPGFLIDN